MIEQAQNNYYAAGFVDTVGVVRDKVPHPLHRIYLPLGVWPLGGSRLDNILYAVMFAQLDRR